VVAYYYRDAADKESKANEMAARAAELMAEVRALRKLAQDTEAQFPDAKVIEAERGPMLTNMPQITFEELQKELLKKGGRVRHVAKRLKVSETAVRDLIRTPNSRFYIAARGWIKPKPAQPSKGAT
jgi:hypothetical protein